MMAIVVLDIECSHAVDNQILVTSRVKLAFRSVQDSLNGPYQGMNVVTLDGYDGQVSVVFVKRRANIRTAV